MIKCGLIIRIYHEIYMKDLSNVLELLITNSGLSENELSKKMNITVATLNKIKTGVISNPTLQTLSNIAQYFGITIDQLVGKAPLETFFSKNLHCVPILDIKEIISHNAPNLTFTNHHEWTRVELDESISKHNIFATMTDGDAMFPLLDKQTIIIVDRDKIPANKSLVLVYIAKVNEILIRKLLIDGSFKILKPINNSFSEIKLTSEDNIVGTVIATIKEHNKQ